MHPDWESYEGDEALGRHDNVLGFSTIVKGDVDAALAAADVVVRGRYVTDPVQGVPIEPRAIVAQWQGDRVTIWSSTQVPYAARAGVAHTLGDPRVERPRDRAAPRRRLRREVRLPLRGPRRRARPRRGTAREARLLAPRGVLRGRPPARGDGDRARDRREERRHARSPAGRGSCSTTAPTAARAASSRRWRRCTRSGRTSSRTSTSSRRSSTRTTSRPRRSARRRRRRCAGRSSSTWTSWPRRSASTRSSSAAAR